MKNFLESELNAEDYLNKTIVVDEARGIASQNWSDLDINWNMEPEDIINTIYLDYGRNPNKYKNLDPEILDIGKNIEVWHTYGSQVPDKIKKRAKDKVDRLR